MTTDAEDWFWMLLLLLGSGIVGDNVWSLISLEEEENSLEFVDVVVVGSTTIIGTTVELAFCANDKVEDDGWISTEFGDIVVYNEDSLMMDIVLTWILSVAVVVLNLSPSCVANGVAMTSLEYDGDKIDDVGNTVENCGVNVDFVGVGVVCTMISFVWLVAVDCDTLAVIIGFLLTTSLVDVKFSVSKVCDVVVIMSDIVVVNTVLDFDKAMVGLVVVSELLLLTKLEGLREPVIVANDEKWAVCDIRDFVISWLFTDDVVNEITRGEETISDDMCIVISGGCRDDINWTTTGGDILAVVVVVELVNVFVGDGDVVELVIALVGNAGVVEIANVSVGDIGW